MAKRKKPSKEVGKVEPKRKKTPNVPESAHDPSVEQTGLLYGDHDDVGRADKPTDYDDPDVCFQVAMNNPRA